jgi:outer membrane protein assembly factor BamB
MNLTEQDMDLGGGGAVILPDQVRGPFPHLVLGCAKSGTLYLLNRDHFGHYNSSSNSQIVQSFMVDNNWIYSTPLFWQNTLYVVANLGPVRAFRFSTVTDQFQTQPLSASSQSYVYPGATPVLSAAGTENAILWVIDPATPGVLHAYDPSNLNTEFWNSSQAANKRDQAGTGVKFTVPTVANGKVYIGTQSELDVYGLLPN